MENNTLRVSDEYTDMNSPEVRSIVLEAVQVSIDQVLQGKTTPMEQVFAELDREMGWA